MVFLVFAFAGLLIGFGLWGIVSPATLLAFLSRWQTREGLWAGAAIRLIFGLALWSAAPLSRVPTTLQVVGVIFVVAGIAMPFIGVARFTSMVAWWLNKPPSFTRVWAVATLALGVFFVWAVAG
ncbi:MAG: hypothetical protein OXC18_14080 [Desulfurellaceae bacterium]|nr:hypothetical protein [Desulfurellaceae bacterium]